MLKSVKHTIVALLLALFADRSSMADNRGHGHHRNHAPGHSERWRGDIGHFNQYDLGRWRGGHWYKGRHTGHVGWWWVVAGVWYFYPAPIYPYPDPYEPPLAVPAPPPATPQFWYYCPDPSGYYPYVPRCSTDWQPVPPTPSAPLTNQPSPDY